MKAIISISLIGFIFPYSALADQCTLPQSLKGKDILAVVNSSYSPDNPMAGYVYRMSFDENGNYSYMSLNESKEYKGTYRYQKVAENIANIESSTEFNNIKVNYTMTLICETNVSGSYFYQQNEGLGDMRSNTAKYYFMAPLP